MLWWIAVVVAVWFALSVLLLGLCTISARAEQSAARWMGAGDGHAC